jgi:hypothetical protein
MRLDLHDTYSGLALIGKSLMSPLKRLEDDVRAGGWLAAPVVALWQLATRDAFTVILTISLLASAWDYFAGVRLAKHRNRYNSTLASAGMWGKISGVALLLLVRALELWVNWFGELHTNGYIATGLTFALTVAELRSIAHNREQ